MKKLKDQWESVENTDVRFTTNPLHLTMLNEVVFEKKFQLPDSFGIYNLFDEFVKIKFFIYYKRKGGVKGTETAEEVCRRDTYNLRTIHCAIAVKILTTENHDKLPNLKIQCEDGQELDRIGFLKQDDDEKEEKKENEIEDMVFIHRSFAEFFYSIYLIDKLENPIVQKITRKLFECAKTDEQTLLVRFLNENPEKGELMKQVLCEQNDGPMIL